MAVISKILPLASLLLLAGCTQSTHYTGHWRGHHDLPGSSTDPRIYTVGKIDLTIYDSGKFDLVQAGMNRTGRVSYQNGSALLQVEEVQGRPLAAQGNAEELNKPIEIQLVEGDQGLRYFDPSAPEPIRKSIVLHREKSKPQ